ncbi:hypothetical protein D9M68_906140 [compost metagenome]
MIVHQWRHGEIWQTHRTRRTKQQEMVGGHRGLERMPLFLTPAWQKLIDTTWINDGARQDMRANFPALFKNDD